MTAINTVKKYNIKLVTGFSLIEVMIVLTVIGVLIAIIAPSYTAHMNDSRRVSAQSDLIQLSGFMERYFTENGQYHQDQSTPAVAVVLPANITSDYYTYSLSSVNTTSYTLQAALIASTEQSDDECGTMTISSTNVRTATVATTPISGCW